MATNLQRQLSARIEESNLTINALEKKAGLKRSAVRNIVNGLSTKPRVENLRAIAHTLGCTIDELVSPEEHNPFTNFIPITKPDKPKPKPVYRWDSKLFRKAAIAVCDILDQNKNDLTFDSASKIVNEVYRFSLSKNDKDADKDFAKWLIEKTINNRW